MGVSELALPFALAAAVSGLALALRERRRTAALEREIEHAARDLERLQASCARLAPGSLVDRIITDGIDASAERKEATALFADLVGYTALSERLDPPDLARILNGYFQRMSDAITEHRGHVATFLGDGILAYFGAFEPNPWQSADAVRAALAMRDALAAYNRELVAEGLPELGLGVGVHRGFGLAGLIGSRERLEFGFVGRTVNLTARVQGLTRTLGTDVLVTEAVRAHLDPRFELRPMPPTEVKGIREPVATYAVVGLRPEGSAPLRG